ncbi:hypothetical protein SPI_05258 [Niveomyces insectorum RCEF 264]|uniref:Uncharacterized protein n=1 Tax=Niveomyces insectorum RCEF 264 TaxID=1081102 RepID=A0A167U4F0_9HYPO|nr:hypothetical protein SPI_05258 [Niveomyces insectorum RCEF 264]
MTGHLASHGRGGAGNMVDSAQSPKLQPKDLETPVLRTAVVTTGRGGTGNMAKNRDPAETRARQDVEPVTRRPSQGATHVGRGGTGNVFKPGSAEASSSSNGDAKPARHPSPPSHGRAHSEEKSLAAKGKEWLLGKR